MRQNKEGAIALLVQAIDAAAHSSATRLQVLQTEQQFR